MKIIYFFYEILLLIDLRLKNTLSKNSSPPSPTDSDFFIWGNADVTEKTIPKIIWTYWSGPPSPSANACLASIKNTNKDFTVVVINDSNLYDYLPDFPLLPQNLYVQLASDVIRLSLLEKFGGIWIDHSVISTSSLNWVIDAAQINKAETVCFYNTHPSAYKNDKSRPIIENGFIAATKGSSFIGSWLKNFKACIFSHDWREYYSSHTNFKQLTTNFQKNSIKKVSYLSCYVAAQETMMQSQNHRLLLINVEDDFYFYEFKNKSLTKRTKLIEWILIAKEPQITPKLVKLRRMHRGVADLCIKNKYYNSLSILGKYINS